MKDFAQRALDLYGLDYTQLLPVQKGYRNEIYPIVLTDGSMVQLTLYKSESGMLERITRADAVSVYAAKKGLPARTRAHERTIVFTSGTRSIYGALYDYLPGQTISWEAYTKAHIKVLGQTLSNLHAALQDFDSIGQPYVIDEYKFLLSKMTVYFLAPNVQKALVDKLGVRFLVGMDRYERLLEGCLTLPGAQQLHMDFVRGNVLFEGTEITGILDFEKTAVGHPLFDVARTLAFLLVDCKFKSEQEVKKYFLQSGYTKRGAARLAYYPGLLDRLVEFFLVYDLYKFLRHNPYESLRDNEHFMRTLAILASSGVVHYH
jgi:Ser/Thr protein kinase RdoA (MazF antagonist)